MDDGKKVNAIKFYDALDMVGCILFKVFTVYVRSRIHARLGDEFDEQFTEKIHGIFRKSPGGLSQRQMVSCCRSASLTCLMAPAKTPHSRKKSASSAASFDGRRAFLA
jgi:hypothetical protein